MYRVNIDTRLCPFLVSGVSHSRWPKVKRHRAYERITMEQRLAYAKAAPQRVNALRNLQAYVDSCSFERPLLELVKARASQINGCAYCLDMHTKDARAAGESEQRLYLLSAWREVPFYSERERAALAWTEAVTRIADGTIEDDLYEEVRRHFDEREIIDLTLLVIAING